MGNTVIPSPPIFENLTEGTKLIAGLSVSTVLADFDFETYSPAGFIWNSKTNTFDAPKGAKDKGLFAIGTGCYSEHPDTEVLCLAYNLKNGTGLKNWLPGQPLPEDLFNHVRQGRLIEAWNCSFEYWIWTNVCIPKYNFPALQQFQLRDAMAKSRAFGLPGSLDAAGNVLNIKNKKLKDGKRLINKFSIPRKPTKKDPRIRILLHEDPTDAALFYSYNLRDIEAEAEISSLIPDLNLEELKFWQCDQIINFRGVRMDRASIKNCMKIVEQAHAQYNNELRILTNYEVEAASKIEQLKKWMQKQGVITNSLTADKIEELLHSGIQLPPPVRRALEIRELIGSAAVKKLYSMSNQITRSDRIHDLFVYHSARTGRAAGAGPQPQNLPNSGPVVFKCGACSKHSSISSYCPWCGHNVGSIPGVSIKQVEWGHKSTEDALETISSGSLECVEMFWGDAVAAISGCLRGLFIASPGHDLICSDYSAIEAVVLAALAGEEWRMEVFRTHGQIYEMSASKITGIPFEEFEKHRAMTGQHHPMRKKVGKVAELASGYQGWIGAWKQFGADEFFNDDEIRKAVLSWRNASPMIVEMWGGQQRDWRPEYYGLEGAAVQAVINPGIEFTYRRISYLMRGDILYCRLLSGRYITYHRPRLSASDRRQDTYSLSFEGWNTNPKNGAKGWVRMFTYGGKLTENVVQATARDILAHAIINLEAAGYPVVLHVHDEIVSEIPENYGSLEEFEKIMATFPAWAVDSGDTPWPISARNGWRAKRYSK